MISRFERFGPDELIPAAEVTGSSRLATVLDQSIANGLLCGVAITALAHGGVEPWSFAIFALMVVGLMAAWIIKASLDECLEIVVQPATLPVIGLLIVGLVQSVAYTGADGQRVSLSLDVEATRHAVMILFFLVVSYVVAANFLVVTRARLLLLANVLTVFGAIVAAFALIQYFTWDGRFYWLRATQYSVFGPFVNRNHFAGYVAMLMPIPLGLILKAVRGQARLVYGFSAVLMGTAIIVSNSRSGLISLTAGLGLMAVLSRRSGRRSSFRRLGPIPVVTLAMIATVVWIGATPTIVRLGEAIDAAVHSGSPDVTRPTIWRETLKMVRDRPMLGAGLGTYRTVYPSYAETTKLFGLDYAHNDYLQVLADTGVVGGVIAAWFIYLMLSALARGIRSADPLFSGLALASGTGMVAVAVQSLSDTDLQIPSNALLFLVLAAVVSRCGDLRQSNTASLQIVENG